MKNLLERIDGMRVYWPPVDGGWLKYFAAAVMLIDHAAYAFLERGYTPQGLLVYQIPGGLLLDRILRAVGRQAFPIFCFFLVEGFQRTHSRMQYFLRLAVFAAVSQYPFQKCLFSHTQVFHGSVFCTLGMGFIAIWVMHGLEQAFLDPGEEIARTRRLFNIAVFGLAAGSTVYGLGQLALRLQTDYSYGGVVMIVLLYVLRRYRIPALFISWLWLSWYNKFELYSAPAFLMLAGYNGKRGKQMKYFFYIFYPVHLLLLYLVRRRLFGA